MRWRWKFWQRDTPKGEGLPSGEEGEDTVVHLSPLRPRPTKHRRRHELGPLGLIAARYPGSEILTGKGPTFQRIAVAGKLTVRQVIVHHDWPAERVIDGLEANGRYRWIDGEWVDKTSSPSIRHREPAQTAWRTNTNLDGLQPVDVRR